MENSPNEIALVLPATVRVWLSNGQVEEMKLETYLAGAVAAEIGVNAPLEALKAQAVASRTYVVSAERHHDQQADVCVTGHCQKWKRVDPVSAPEVFRALSETWGMVAVHGGKLIDAFFFDHCDGHTRSAEEMLIPAADYLRGVDCSCGHLNLKGHGVGMCERGAIVMARRGATFVQILRHYYRGIVVMRMMAEKPAAAHPEQAKPSHAPTAPPKIIARPRDHAASPAVRQPAAREALKGHLRPRVINPPENLSSASLVPSGRALLKKISLPFRHKPAPAEPTPLQASAPAEETATPAERAPADESATAPKLKSVFPLRRAAPPATKALQADERAPVSSTVEQAAPAPASTATPAPVVAAPALETSPLVAPVAEPALETLPLVAPVAEPTLETPPLVAPVAEQALPPLEGIEIKPARRMYVDHLPGARMIAGCLTCAGIVVAIANGDGRQTLVFSGSAPHYGAGGFETIIDEDGTYHVTIEDETLEVQVKGEIVFIHAA